MSQESPVAILFNSDGYELNVKPGVAIPAGTSSILAAGSDGTNSRFITVDSSGQQVIVGSGVAGTPTGGVLTIQGDSGGTAVPISGSITASNASIGTNGSAIPGSSTLIGFSDGTNLRPGTVFDADTGAGTQYLQGVNLRLSASGGSVEFGTSTNPIRIDPTGSTTQPISGTVTANIGTTNGLALDATLTGGTQTTRITDGTNTATVKPGSTSVVSGDSALVVAISPNNTIAISGTVTANIGTTGGLALDATLAKLTISPGTALGSNTLAMVGGSVSTSAPTYINGNINQLSLTTAGALRVDGSGVTQPVSGTVTSNQGISNTLANAWATKITDTTNGPVAVKAASTAAVAADPALVVAVSPNNTLFSRDKEFSTFTALATATALGNNKSMISIQNTTGSAVKCRIHEIYLVNVQTSATTRVAANFEIRRATSHSGGTAITAIEKMETTDTLDSSITVRTNATITGESSTLLWRNIWSSDDWGPGTLDTESSDHAFQTMFPIYSRKTQGLKPIILNANETLTVKCATNTTSGTFDLMVVFTQE